MPSTTISLSDAQKNACNSFLKFLLSDQKEFYLFGAAGCGKTFLTQLFLSKVLTQYKNTCKVLGKEYPFNFIYVTATTNKAVEVLRQNTGINKYSTEDVQTVYHLFNVTVGNNFKTGESYLQESKKTPITNSLIVIDECSMLPTRMINIIRRRTKDCKIIYVGDNYQLPPVNEQPHWDSVPQNMVAYLNTPMRNKTCPNLIKLCEQLRETVRTGVFKDIYADGKEIIKATDSDVLAWLSKRDVDTTKVLSYTNTRTLQYIDLCHRKINPGEPKFVVGKKYINNSNYESSTSRFYAEETIKILQLNKPKQYVIPNGDTYTGYYAKVASCCTKKEAYVFVMADPKEIAALSRKAAKQKDWPTYFYLKDNIMDLRSIYACTVHKSQGSTYDEVLIDLESFADCKDPTIIARLLYVAVSRAKYKVIFYGSLKDKYGRLICQ